MEQFFPIRHTTLTLLANRRIKNNKRPIPEDYLPYSKVIHNGEDVIIYRHPRDVIFGGLMEYMQYDYILSHRTLDGYYGFQFTGDGDIVFKHK